METDLGREMGLCGGRWVGSGVVADGEGRRKQIYITKGRDGTGGRGMEVSASVAKLTRRRSESAYIRQVNVYGCYVAESLL